MGKPICHPLGTTVAPQTSKPPSDEGMQSHPPAHGLRATLSLEKPAWGEPGWQRQLSQKSHTPVILMTPNPVGKAPPRGAGSALWPNSLLGSLSSFPARSQLVPSPFPVHSQLFPSSFPAHSRRGAWGLQHRSRALDAAEWVQLPGQEAPSL